MNVRKLDIASQPATTPRERGQTLVIALIVLGVLLILGFVFLGIIDRNVRNTGLAGQRTVANDLAEGGIRYAHSQLLTSQEGADWRGTPFYTASATPQTSGDPDLFYLRPGTGYGLRSDTDTVLDQGGPDGLGPFIRVQFENGRALVRVRYSPSDASLFTAASVGPLRNPGQARDFLIIEAVGRSGSVNVNDPTTANVNGGLQYTGYTNSTQFRTALSALASADAKIATSRKLIAMQAIGITEQALFITNHDRVNRPAELGIPAQLGATYFDSATNSAYEVGSLTNWPNSNAAAGGTGLAMIVGGKSNVPNGSGTPTSVSGSGGIYVNGDLNLYGNTELFLNQSLGEGLYVAGSIIPDSSAQLLIDSSRRDAQGNWTDTVQPVNSGNTLNSRNPAFTTENGAILDGVATTDSSGYPRGAGRKEPPSIEVADPVTGLNRYVAMTRESGALVSGVNAGRYGYGRGVYVDNFSDRQIPSDESGRENVGAQDSLLYDWLNPNNGQAQSGWQGQYYTPLGAYVQLLPDGFVIVRDGRDPDALRYWRLPNGTSTGQTLVRYRLGRGSDGALHIVNTFTFPSNSTINTQTLAPTDFDNGPVFNGVLYFEGNVRVRGTIPTDIQLMLVSNATIYVEGSITKGVTGTEWTATRTNSNVPGADNNLPSIPAPSSGNPSPRITYPPLATLMLAAKDYVAINTTMFFGPAPSQLLNAVNDVPDDLQFKPVRIKGDGSESLQLQTEFALDPSANPSNPSLWKPFAVNYVDAVTPANTITPKFLIAHTMDDGPAPASFVSLLINDFGSSPISWPNPGQQYANTTYQFAATSPDFPGTTYNLYASITGGNGPFPYWGLGGETWQRYSKFEQDAFPIIAPNSLSADGSTMYWPDNNGVPLYAQGTNEISLQPEAPLQGYATNDYLVARTCIVPHDIRIESSMYAEEGAVFVIPGPWLNPNPSDRHDLYTSLGNTPAEQAQARLENFGSMPEFPFYGEPPDVKLSIIGAISESMPVRISDQAAYYQKWGWIPRQHGATSEAIPTSHVPSGYNVAGSDSYVPNLTISYDTVLATGNTVGDVGSSPFNAIRVDAYGRELPPIPRLPVSPALAYFGEVG